MASSTNSLQLRVSEITAAGFAFHQETPPLKVSAYVATGPSSQTDNS